MLKLIKCEFWKLKRKKLIYAFLSLALFFPVILVYMTKAGSTADTTEHYLQTRFDYAYTMMLGYGLVFLLPCLIGIIAAVLFLWNVTVILSKIYERSPLRIRNSFWLRFHCYSSLVFLFA